MPVSSLSVEQIKAVITLGAHRGPLSLALCVSPTSMMLESSMEASWYLWGHLHVPQLVARVCRGPRADVYFPVSRDVQTECVRVCVRACAACVSVHLCVWGCLSLGMRI